MFGQWIHNVDTLRLEFDAAKPFKHVVLEPFLDEEVAVRVNLEFPSLSEGKWYYYNNPIEKKYTMDKISSTKYPQIAEVFGALMSEQVISQVRRLTGIADLEADPHLHGAGLHYHPHGGKLDMHLDYSIHPISGKERRLNIILYLNRSWQESWGGHLELWNQAFTSCEKAVVPAFNRAVLFETSDISYHGLPRPISCPESEGRKSLALYYVSPPRPLATHRVKAQFRPLPGEVLDKNMLELYEIRSHRRIERSDLEKLCPDFLKDDHAKTSSACEP